MTNEGMIPVIGKWVEVDRSATHQLFQLVNSRGIVVQNARLIGKGPLPTEGDEYNRRNEVELGSVGYRARWFGSEIWEEYADYVAREPTQLNTQIACSPYQGNDEDLDRQHAELTQKLSVNESARLRNIAALKAEQAEPLAQRRAKLDKRFGPRPCDVWPNGGDYEP